MASPLMYATIITVLLISDALLAILSVLLYRRYKKTDDPAEPPMELVHMGKQVETLSEELKSVAPLLDTLIERIERIEDQLGRLQELSEKQQTTPTKASPHKAYEVAAKMVLQGADTEQLIEICGLSRAEAELIQRLHHAESTAVLPKPSLM